MTIGARYRRWLFVRGELHALALFRIGWSLSMFIAAQTEAELPALYSRAHYHVPLVSWATPLDAAQLGRLLCLAQLGAVLAGSGALPRLGTALVLGALGYLFALDLLLFRIHVYLGLLTGALLLLSPAGRVLSAQAWLRGLFGRPCDTRGSLVTAQLIKAQVLIVYGYSVLNKLRPSFLDGFTLQQELPFALRESVLHGSLFSAPGVLAPAVQALLRNDAAMAAVSYVVVAVEAFLTLGLPLRRLRPWAIGLGLLLHGSIYLLMDIRVFGLLMVSSYGLFLEPRRTDPLMAQPVPD